MCQRSVSDTRPFSQSVCPQYPNPNQEGKPCAYVRLPPSAMTENPPNAIPPPSPQRLHDRSHTKRLALTFWFPLASSTMGLGLRQPFLARVVRVCGGQKTILSHAAHFWAGHMTHMDDQPHNPLKPMQLSSLGVLVTRAPTSRARVTKSHSDYERVWPLLSSRSCVACMMHACDTKTGQSNPPP
jgi:hypothetical protein